MSHILKSIKFVKSNFFIRLSITERLILNTMNNMNHNVITKKINSRRLFLLSSGICLKTISTAYGIFRLKVLSGNWVACGSINKIHVWEFYVFFRVVKWKGFLISSNLWSFYFHQNDGLIAERLNLILQFWSSIFLFILFV